MFVADKVYDRIDAWLRLREREIRCWVRSTFSLAATYSNLIIVDVSSFSVLPKVRKAESASSLLSVL
jgi:hypothetical protein